MRISRSCQGSWAVCCGNCRLHPKAGLITPFDLIDGSRCQGKNQAGVPLGRKNKPDGAILRGRAGREKIGFGANNTRGEPCKCFAVRVLEVDPFGMQTHVEFRLKKSVLSYKYA